MNSRNIFQLALLAALWGASFLFIRVGVTDFGVAPLMALRVGIGALSLAIVLVARRPLRQSLATLRSRAVPLLVVGILNSAAPFCLFRSPTVCSQATALLRSTGTTNTANI